MISLLQENFYYLNNLGISTDVLEPADHAANISEDILFLLEARVASHQKKLTPPKDEN
jgi:hypothetical protein